MNVILWAIVTYFIASIPFSLLIGHVFLGVDIRNYGDANPGASNVKRAGGNTFLVALAVLLDGFKGLFPVGVPYWLMGWQGYEIVPVAIAAIAGHAFSIFLGFRGGKAVAITGGVWVGLIVFEGVLVVPLTLVYWYYVVNESEWAVLLMLFSLLAYLLYTRGVSLPLLLIWLGNFLLVVFKHWDGLQKLPTIRRPKGHQ
jgi:acyl phosphate:glycerol-3-phosphate acyltransferase